MFLCQRNFGILGAFFFIGVRQQHRLLCTEQCPEVVKKVSILLSTFLCLYSKFFKEHVLKKKNQNSIPFWVAPLLLSHRGQEQLDTLLGLDLDPVIIFFLRNTSIIGEISLQNLTKKSNHSFG